MTKIYISSTYSDLIEHRQRVYDVLRKMRYDVIAMEDYVATDKRPLDKCLDDVASCHVYVGIFAWRYGYIPLRQERSITELEYRQAGQSGLERLIFLLDEDAPWPRKYMDEVTGEGEKGQKIKELRRELMAAHLLQFFKSPEELAGQVAASAAGLAEARLEADMDSLRARRDQADRERREIRESQRVVNLPPLDVTYFKDRLSEIQALCDHLAESSVRLVNVVGRGGMGKTALVSRALVDLERGALPVPGEERELPIDGILYLGARSTGLSLERIYADVGRMLGEPAASKLAAHWADKDVPLELKVETLLETMRDGLYLILLDNLEEELTEDGEITDEGLHLFIERCLTQPGGARLIATSRKEVKIADAALHSKRSIPLHEGLPEDEAVALLRDLDLDPQRKLGLRGAPEDDLRHAARLTRGIPHALERLAGILHEDPTASLSRLLADEDTFGVEVVEELVAEGYRRLGDDEQRVMEALAVFDRPVDETATAYLLHPWFPGLDVRGCLRRLVNSYFVSASRVTGSTAYALHPLDRDYAYRQIPDPPGEEGGPEAYSRCNLELRAADFYAGIRKPESEWKTIDDLAPQLAEFEHRVCAGDYDGAARVLQPIDSECLYRWGHYARLVEMGEKLLGRLTDRGLQADILGSVGRACRALGEVERAVELCKEALEIAKEINDPDRQGIQLGNLGRAYIPLGQLEQAKEFDEQALAIARKRNDLRRESELLGHRGNTYRALGQFKRAIKLHEEALAIAEKIGDHAEQGRHYGNLGRVYFSQGEAEKAIELHEKALTIAHDISERRIESYQLLWLSQAWLAAGEPHEAWTYCEEAVARDVPETSYQAALARGIVLLHQKSEDAGEAFTDAGKAFADAASRSRAMLGRTADLYEARYTLAAALVGGAVCDPRWAEESERAALLAPALAEYRRALKNCDASGVVQDARRDLEMFQAAGVVGLEPVVEVLSQDH